MTVDAQGVAVNTRRSFFQRIASMVAVVALAPELAFRTKLELPEVEQGIDTDYTCVIQKTGYESPLRSEKWTFKVENGCYILENYEHPGT